MLFTYSKTAGRVFDGPPVHRGLLAGFTIGEQRWARRALKLDSLDRLDSSDLRCLYHFMTLRRIDHELVPAEKFDDLTVLDFELAKHAYVRDVDDPGESCRECNQHAEFACHQGVPVDPTPPASTPSTSAPE